jgi:hypothetical protein
LKKSCLLTSHEQYFAQFKRYFQTFHLFMNLHEFVSFHYLVIVTLFFCNVIVMMTLYVGKRSINKPFWIWNSFKTSKPNKKRGFFHKLFSSTKLKGLFIDFSILNLLMRCQKIFDANTNKCKYCKTFVIFDLSQSFQPPILIPKLIHHYLKTMMHVIFFQHYSRGH